jgi:hypothetical protein
MQSGMVNKILHTDEQERQCALQVSRLDDMLSNLREKIRLGQRLGRDELEAAA